MREYELVPLEEDVFVVWEPQSQFDPLVTSSALPDGPRFARFPVRATPEVS
ncbi:hypothetical protein [Saccharothrix xinjiangensis]|uniref:Uncharacterized protein n=1 Tax=Saccharothrix xinjiangensis TaxID=204798 RepID=A0ABV9YD35_9PSEU